MKAVEFAEKQYEKTSIDYGLCTPPTTSDEALDVLIEHVLGKDW